MPEITSPSSKRVKEAVQNQEIGMADIRSSKKNKSPLFYIGILVFLSITSIAIYSSYELRQLKNPARQQEMAQKKVKTLIEEVSKIMELPEETPQVATVSDVEVLKKTQSFFIKAQNGDEVLVYSTQAILYRPASHKIINVASVNRDTSTDTVVTKKEVVKDEEKISTTTKK